VFGTSFIIGLSIGSFVNVCIYRIPRRISVVKPRSFCPNCKTTLRWYELIPILSYLSLRGKCRKCGAKISIRYPIIELVCGGVFVYLFMMDGLTMGFVGSVTFFVLLLTIAVIDWEHLIIPNGIVVLGLVLGTTIDLFISVNTVITALGSALIAGAVMFVIRWLGNAAFKKETMGIGDVKLAALVGLFIGVQNFLLAVWAAAIIGCIYWVIKYYLMSSSKEIKLPFGSFLALTSFIVLMASNQIDRFIGWLIFQQ
jgi:leader peptidase (prepilin peptidase)/N-methyltransferase